MNRNLLLKSIFSLAFLVSFSLGQLMAQATSEEPPAIDHSYKPLTIKLDKSGKKYIRFITWHQMWVTSNNLTADDQRTQFSASIRRSRFLAFAQVSPKFLILTHWGLNGLTSGNLNALGNQGNGPQLFLHGAWTEFKLTNELYVGAGLHYWKGLTRLANQSTLNFMTMDNTRPFAHWHSLGITDQFARHLGIYAKGGIDKFQYRLAINNPMRPENALGAGMHFGTRESSLTYTGSSTPDADGDPMGNTIVEGYFNYNIWDKESNKLPYFVGTYLGKKKVLSVGAGFFLHPNGMYDTSSDEHENVTHLGLDVFLDMPVGTGALNAYASFMSYNYGENYVSRWAGTGNVFYAQAGYLIPGTKIMPYISYQNANYDGFEETVSEVNIGANYFILGHHAKITLEYHQITNDIREGAITDFADNNTLGQIRLQAHIFL
ncbi:MAG: porin [Bacteroidota bacterium]